MSPVFKKESLENDGHQYKFARDGKKIVFDEYPVEETIKEHWEIAEKYSLGEPIHNEDPMRILLSDAGNLQFDHEKDKYIASGSSGSCKFREDDIPARRETCIVIKQITDKDAIATF